MEIRNDNKLYGLRNHLCARWMVVHVVAARWYRWCWQKLEARGWSGDENKIAVRQVGYVQYKRILWLKGERVNEHTCTCICAKERRIARRWFEELQFHAPRNLLPSLHISAGHSTFGKPPPAILGGDRGAWGVAALYFGEGGRVDGGGGTGGGAHFDVCGSGGRDAELCRLPLRGGGLLTKVGEVDIRELRELGELGKIGKLGELGEVDGHRTGRSDEGDGAEHDGDDGLRGGNDGRDGDHGGGLVSARHGGGIVRARHGGVSSGGGGEM